jgi:hypothetical protein
MPDILFKADGQKVENFNKDKAESTALFNEIKQAFPWFDVGSHRAVSQSYVHEIINKRVMRTCLMMNYAESIVDGTFGTAHRLFDLDAGTSMIYVTKLFEGEQPSWATENMFVLGQTEHHEEFRKPCDPAMLSFTEYFFIASDDRLVEMQFDLTDRNQDTLFSVLVSNDQVVAQRRYTNFDPLDAGVLANWQMMYVMYAKKARRMDLVRKMFSLPYIGQLTDA